MGGDPRSQYPFGLPPGYVVGCGTGFQHPMFKGEFCHLGGATAGPNTGCYGVPPGGNGVIKQEPKDCGYDKHGER